VSIAQQRDDAEMILRSVEDAVREQFPASRVTTIAVSEPADDALAAASRTARLVVVGCEDVSMVGALLVGSATSAIIERASCPVIAWRGGCARVTDEPIVVGVAASAGDGAALHNAFSLADALAAPLRVIHGWAAWGVPDDVALPHLIEMAVSSSRGNNERDAAQWRQLSDVVDPWRLRYPGVEVTLLGMTAAPSKALLEHVRDAQMVVVGCRHRNTLSRYGFRSVSLKLLRHAQLPVVVCPAP
jgi:nucleotide-binding universal stress UspA family protein